MRASQTTPPDVDTYIAGFPDGVREALEKVRGAIREAAPDAEETISYRIPAFTLAGRYLVYVAAHTKHIGLYPVPVGNAEFGDELAAYAYGRGTARFPLDAPLPLALIRKIVAFRAKENLEAMAAKRKRG